MSSSISSNLGFNMARTRAQILRTKPTHFLNLPPELRINEIYKYLLPSPKDIKAIQPWNGAFQKHTRKQKDSISTDDDDTQQKWSWTTLLLVNRELHDEIAVYIYSNMEICLLLTPDTTIDENHAVFSKPQTVLDPPPDHGMLELQGLQMTGVTSHQPQDYQMQLMLLEQQNKRRLLLARQHQDALDSLASPSSFRMRQTQQQAQALLQQQQTQRLAQHQQMLQAQQTRQAQMTRPQALQQQQYQLQHAQWPQQTLPTPVSSIHISGPANAVIQPSGSAPAPPVMGMAPQVTSMPSTQGGNHSLQDYQMQLMLLEHHRRHGREFYERQANIHLTAYSRDERDGFLHSCCNDKSAGRARILQFRHFPTPNVLLPAENYGPEALWCSPVADRYKALVGTVRVVCDFVMNWWMPFLGDDTVEDVQMRMVFELVDVVEKLKASGLRSRMVIEVCLVGHGYDELLWKRVKRLLKPFELCNGLPTPEFERLLWIDQSESKKEELVSEGKVNERLYEPCSSQFADFLEDWKSKVSRHGPPSPFPAAVTACRLIDEFISLICELPAKRKQHTKMELERCGRYSASSLLVKKTVEGEEFHEFEKFWQMILQSTWDEDEKLMKELMADEYVDLVSPKKRGKSMAGGRNIPKLRQLMRSINEIVGAKLATTAALTENM